MQADEDFRGQIDQQYRDFRDQLMHLIHSQYDEALSKRCSPEDILQETAAAMMRSPDFLKEYPDMTPYDKWKRMTFNTLTDIRRRHLLTQKRAASCEISFVRAFDTDDAGSMLMEFMEKSVSTPRSKAELRESSETLMTCYRELCPEDQRILSMRQFDRYTAKQCAESLGISLNESKAAYLRAVRHLRKKLARYSGLLP